MLFHFLLELFILSRQFLKLFIVRHVFLAVLLVAVLRDTKLTLHWFQVEAMCIILWTYGLLPWLPVR